jgi:hypothetical protein
MLSGGADKAKGLDHRLQQRPHFVDVCALPAGMGEEIKEMVYK